MHPDWQKINARCHFCHWWQDHDWRMINAMTYLYLMLILAAALSIHSVLMVLHDGRGPQRPPASHFEDPQFRSPLAG